MEKKKLKKQQQQNCNDNDGYNDYDQNYIMLY